MFDLSNLNQVKEMLFLLERKTDKSFYPIEFNNFSIMLLGGSTAQCNPQRYLGKVTSYNSVEVAIAETLRDEVQIIAPGRDERFKNFSWVQFFSYQDYRKKMTPGYMGTYVPLIDVPIMIREIYKVSRLKMFF